jgi:hypothetical protein
MGYCPVLDKYCWLNEVLSWLGQVLLRTLLKDLLKDLRTLDTVAEDCLCRTSTATLLPRQIGLG